MSIKVVKDFSSAVKLIEKSSEALKDSSLL
jgi:hypothetical protein